MMDLTPMVDVMFTLMLFFILSYTYQNNETQTSKVKVPDNPKSQLDRLKKNNAIVINILNNGSIVLNNKTISLSQLVRTLKTIIKNRNDSPEVLIYTESNVNIKSIMSVIQGVKSAGIKKSPFIAQK